MRRTNAISSSASIETRQDAPFTPGYCVFLNTIILFTQPTEASLFLMLTSTPVGRDFATSTLSFPRSQINYTFPTFGTRSARGTGLRPAQTDPRLHSDSRLEVSTSFSFLMQRAVEEETLAWWASLGASTPVYPHWQQLHKGASVSWPTVCTHVSISCSYDQWHDEASCNPASPRRRCSSSRSPRTRS